MRRTALTRLSWQTEYTQRGQIELSENFDNATQALHRLNHIQDQEIELIIKGSYQFFNTITSHSELRFEEAFKRRTSDIVAMKLWKAKLSRKSLQLIKLFEGEQLHIENTKFLVEPHEMEDMVPDNVSDIVLCDQKVDRYVNKFMKELLKRRALKITLKRIPFRSFKVVLGEQLQVLCINQTDNFSDIEIRQVLALLHRMSVKRLEISFRSTMPGTIFDRASPNRCERQGRRSRNSVQRNRYSIQRTRNSIRRNRARNAAPRTRLLQTGEIVMFNMRYLLAESVRIPKLFIRDLPSSLEEIEMRGYFPTVKHKLVDNMAYWSACDQYTLGNRRAAFEQDNLDQAETYFM